MNFYQKFFYTCRPKIKNLSAKSGKKDFQKSGLFLGINNERQYKSNYFSIKKNKTKLFCTKIINNVEKLINMEYSLNNFHRSNQDTCLVHKPSVFPGEWVQSGDLLADCSAVIMLICQPVNSLAKRTF